ncbi:MAG: hypothetical protein ACP5GI_00715 [Sulfolobales archaeon]
MKFMTSISILDYEYLLILYVRGRESEQKDPWKLQEFSYGKIWMFICFLVVKNLMRSYDLGGIKVVFKRSGGV